MTSIRHFKNISLSEMTKKFDELNDIVGSATKPGEKINIEAVAAKVAAKNDPVLSSAFEKVRSQISMIEGPVQQNDAPLETNGHQAQNAFSMFLDAKKSLSEIDSDGNGQISRGEVLRSRLGGGTASTGKDMADAALYGTHVEMEERVVAFLEGNAVVADEMAARKGVYGALKHLVGESVETPLGQKAVTSFLQKLLLKRGQSRDALDTPNGALENEGNLPHHSRMSGDEAETLMKKALQSGERNFLRRLFSSPDLSDKEVGKMVGNADLEAYSASVEKEILTTQKASFEELWLTGSDLQYHHYTGTTDKGAIWGFRLQNDMYAGTDVDPKTIQGIDQADPVSAAETQRVMAAASLPVTDTASAFAKLNASITKAQAADIGAPFSIEVGTGDKWVADFTKSEGPWFEKKDADIKSGFVIRDPKVFLEIMQGKKNATTAFMNGRLEVEGDMSLAMKANALFK